MKTYWEEEEQIHVMVPLNLSVQSYVEIYRHIAYAYFPDVTLVSMDEEQARNFKKPICSPLNFYGVEPSIWTDPKLCICIVQMNNIYP